jgi:hypothetical protein
MRGLAAAARLQVRGAARTCGAHAACKPAAFQPRDPRGCTHNPVRARPLTLAPTRQILRPQGQFRAAIKHLERVLEISREMREFTGDADAVRGEPGGESARLAARPRAGRGRRAPARPRLPAPTPVHALTRAFPPPPPQYGTIADCYTELGDLEMAAANYDRYIKVGGWGLRGGWGEGWGLGRVCVCGVASSNETWVGRPGVDTPFCLALAWLTPRPAPVPPRTPGHEQRRAGLGGSPEAESRGSPAAVRRQL